MNAITLYYSCHLILRRIFPSIHFKVVLFALVAIAAARPGLLVESPLAYAATSMDSGYAYSHSVHTPDYVNQVSVSKPLTTTTVVRSLPAVHAPAAIVSPVLAPAVHTYAAAPLVHAW